MRDELATVLRLVAEGTLSPEEAAPIIEALSASPAATPRAGGAAAADRTTSARDADGGAADTADSSARLHLRFSISERGRQVINLRIPTRYADAAMGILPGIAANRMGQIRSAIAAGARGPILDVEDEDGSRVLITIE
jgi:hypothetical protein